MTRLNSEEGLSEVIGFIMILGLIMVFLSIWVVYGVPSEGRQLEIEHMDYVQDWFTQYKITADSLWINYNEDPAVGYDTSDITISNSLVLGSLGGATHSQGLFLILMRPFGSSGTLSLEDSDTELLEIKDSGITVVSEPMARIQYKASSHYWINQIYYYQMGGVFLEQTDGTVNRVAPLINFNNDSGSQISNIVITNFEIGNLGASKSDSISGDGPVRIDTVLTDRSDKKTLAAGYTINITLKDESAAKSWAGILKELGAPDVKRADNLLTVSGIDSVNYQYANYTVSLQSVAAGYT